MVCIRWYLSGGTGYLYGGICQVVHVTWHLSGAPVGLGLLGSPVGLGVPCVVKACVM